MSPAFAWAFAGMILYGVARGFNDANLMPVLCQVVDERYIDTAYGFLNSLGIIIGDIMGMPAGY